MKRIIQYIFDLLFLTRPVLLIPVWGFCAFGYRCGVYTTTGSFTLFSLSTPITVYIGILVFSLSVASVYILNQIADIDVDKKNGGLPLLASGIVKVSSAWTCAFILFLASVLIPISAGNFQLALLSFASVVLGALYSFKPTCYSGRPLLDFVSNALGYGVIAFAAGWYLSGNNLLQANTFLKASLPYFLLMCAGSISSTMPDRDGDLTEGKNTTAVALGNERANQLAFALLLCALITSIYRFDVLSLICAIAPAPFYIGYMVKPNSFFMESTYKAGGALVMICASMVLPVILVAGIIVFISTKLYFQIRHNVHYPSLMPVK
ncbi:MAG: UbiA family prenyltransferase [Chitinispirillaceae bacterium]|nr:UbiA family prenyltransferase [Chitinispirillaceae bacterium]